VRGLRSDAQAPFFGWLVGTPTLITAQNLLGFTGDTPAVFYWGRAFRPLLGVTGVRRKLKVEKIFFIYNKSTIFASLFGATK